MRLRYRHSRALTRLMAATAIVCAFAGTAAAQSGDRVLGREDILLLGAGLAVEPARQTVPKDIATIVSTFLSAPNLPNQPLPPFAPDALVKATLRGPSFSGPVEITTRPNTPFNIPPLSVAGIHTLDAIRLESGGEVILRGAPETVVIEVIEKLLVTQVTARALTAAEIRERGIVFDRTNFQAYNFTAAFAVGAANPIPISFPIVLPRIQGAAGVSLNEVGLPDVEVPDLPSLQTIIPDTLRLQTQIPNLSVVGFTLTVPGLQGQNLMVPPIPGIVVIPGDIGFLNQYFNVTLLVGNVAPIGSNLVVTGLSAEVVLPPGRDDVPNSGDDPLRMARTAAGESPRIQLVVQPGADGRLGTADDIGSLSPGDSGSAEYLVEGRREGSHVIEMEMTGTLEGLPVGPVTVRGRAAGSVLVRNPTFTLTFTHPELINAGEPYTLDVTVTNTSSSPANFVSVNLYGRNITGAILVGDASRDIESIPPGDSATVSFDLIAQVTGPITAATLDSDENVEGRFALKTSVGELGIPLSPDSLVLPKEANSLPASLRSAALGLLGKAWAVATAPAAALPSDVTRFGKKIVYDRAVELAEAGFRYSLHEPIADSATHLLLDYIGNGYERLNEKNPQAALLAQAQSDYRGFDELRRRSIRGEVLADAVAATLAPELAGAGPEAFHRSLGEKTSFRAGHVSVLLASSSGPLPFTLSVIDSTGRRIGGVDAAGRVIKNIPFGDLLTFAESGTPSGQMALIGSPAAGAYTIQLDRVDGTADTPFTLSLLVPDATGALRHVVFSGLTSASRPNPGLGPADPIRLTVDVRTGVTTPGTAVPPTSNALVDDPAPSVIGVVQQKDADAVVCPNPPAIYFPGRVIAVLFSEEVTPEAVQDRVRSTDLTRYLMEDNLVVGVALQPGRRIAFLALRDPVGPLVARTITISEVTDRLGQPMPAQAVPIEMTVEEEAGVVTGQVLHADGTPAAFTEVRLFYAVCPAGFQGIATRLDTSGVGISSKTTDAEGRFQWDFVLKDVFLDRIAAIDIASGEARTVPFTISRNGQRLNVNVVFLGRGTLSGRTLDESGAPLARTAVKVTSLTDDTEYGATSDADGRFTINRIPVGNIFVEAVNQAARATGTIAEYLSIANGTVTRDITLFNEDSPSVEAQFGTLRGYVLRGDGQQGAVDVPVIAYYKSASQRGVNCPGNPSPGFECAIAVVRTSATGEFVFDRIPAGQFRVTTFDRASYQQGEAGIILAANTTQSFNILLAQGLGTIRGVVLDATGARVPAARVGGGLSLTTADANGEFVLTDVPVGRREIVAVSDALNASGRATVDLVRAGDEQNVTIVLDGIGSVAGRIFQTDGATPIANARVHLFKECWGGCIEVVGTATTDAQGGYTFAGIKLGQYKVSSFRTDFSEGNVAPAPLMFAGQVARINVVYRGGGGRIAGVVFDDDGQTPLAASVGISGDRVTIAGGQVGVGFQHVENYQITQTNFTTGTFAFDGIWVGPVTLRAVGQFSPDPIRFATAIPSPGAQVHVELRLQATAQISGTVFQPDGVTPVGADVIVRYQSNAFKEICNGTDCVRIPQGVQNFTVVTDAQGRYLINPVNAGAFTIAVEDPVSGRVAQVLGETGPAQEAEFDIRLLQLATVTVRIRGSDGVTPIPGARVELRQVGFPHRFITLTAGANGDAVFGGGNALAEGKFAVLATNLQNGFAGRVSGAVTAETESLTITLFLFDAYGRVTGTVFGPDGITPVPNVEVLVGNDEGPLAFAVTDAAGGYSADFVPLGDVEVEAFEAATSRRAFASGRVDFNDQEVPINLSQLGIGQVTGTLYQAGSLTPLKNWNIELFQVTPAGRSFPTLRASSGVDGTFSFPGATVGAFRIRASKPPLNATGDAEGDIVRHGQVVDVPVVVSVPRAINGRIEGQVVNPDGSAAPNTLVNLGRLTTSITTTTDTNGRFTFEDVPVGRLRLTAQSQVSRNAETLYTELQFEGETLQPTIVLVGLTQITGTVYRSDGVTPASFVAVELRGSPSSGCGIGARDVCHANADAAGRFTFDDVPARTFTVVAIDAIADLKGVAGDAVNPGGTRDVRIVLEPSAVVSGRVLLPGNLPAQGVVVEVVIDKPSPEPDARLFAVSDVNGVFSFPAVPSGGPRTFTFDDPIGPGIATRSVQILSGTQTLGDVVLDVGPPIVASTSPSPAAVGVPLNAVVRLVFNEPVAPGSVTQANVLLTHAGGSVPALLSVDEGDTRVSVTPIAPLLEKTIYTISIRNVTDRVGKPMTTPFILGFTSVDLTPPTASSLSPGAGTNGAPIFAPIRITYSEPVDVTRFVGTPLTLVAGTTAVEGQTDFAFGNTVVVFTPTRPLREDATYRVTVQAAVDLSGNAQPQGLDYSFSTTDRTPPVITALVPAGNGTVIENAVTQVVAQASAGHDVAFVDFYVNGILTATSRSEPFTLNLLARPELGAPGSLITVAAIATDTSGNRGTTPVSASVTIVADLAPVVSIVSPAADAPFRNGERVNVTVRVADDLGATQLGYRAETGRPQDAATIAMTPSALFREETFGFNVPATAAPGSRLRVTASALDTKGQSSGIDISLVILDAVPPTVTITGTTTGSRVRPGQDTLVVVSAQDAGSIRELSFEATGAVARSEVRAVEPAQPDVATSFTIHVPETARAGDVIVLRARAVDVAGNATDAAPVTLPVADLNGPTVTLRTDTGLPQAVPGRTVTVIVNAEDETGVTRIDLSGQGAFSLNDVRAISPPIASAVGTFTINVPASATPGSTLTLAATATDLFGNLGQPGTLVLTIQASAGVTLPPSLLTLAGDQTDVTIALAEPAPAGGLVVALLSTNPNVVTAVTPVTFAEGQSSGIARIISIAGGNATINAFIQGVQRAGMTVTVQGGVVRGTVFDPDGLPVSGAQVTVTPPLRVTTTDANGDYVVQGIFTNGTSNNPVVVKVLDPVTRFIGYAAGQLNVSNGSARINAVLIAAGRINGTVLLPDGETAAGAGVRVNLLAPNNLNVPLQTVFTDEAGQYEFPLVTLGTYAVDAIDTNGNRGRATAALAESGDEITVPVQYLGRGVVTGTVRAGGVPAPNAELTFTSASLFGNGPRITRNAEADGTFRFEGVLIGTFTIQAHDPVSNTAGTATGQILADNQTVTANIALTTYGGLTGQVFRPDGVTPVVGASVTARGVDAITDENGMFVLSFVPLGSYTIEATEDTTRSIGRATGTLATHLQVVTQNVVFLAQGSVIATVYDFNGALMPGASVRVTTQNGTISDGQTVTTNANGIAIVERVLVGTVRVNATAGGLSSPQVTRTLTADQVIAVTLTLEATANIVGTLFGPDGQTPVTDGFVGFGSNGYYATPVAADGTFRFDGRDFGTYHLYGFDASRRYRASAFNIVLNQNGVDVVRNLTMVGLGSVIGRVVNPDGSPSGNRSVQVQSLNSQYGGFYTDATDANGNYEVLNRVAVGGFAVTTGSGSLRGEAVGAVALDGEIVRRDIVLVNSAVTLPVTLRDANNGIWDVRQGGQTGSALYNAFVTGGTAAAPQGGFALEIVSGGTTIPFVGDTTFGTTEDGSREIAVRQQITPIAGLSVTRKAFVPISHFARYLEMLTNPTAEPITVSVRIRSSLATNTAPALARTSSGDTLLDVSSAETADRWAVVGFGADGDYFQSTVAFRPSFAWVFDGPGAPARASTVTLQTTSPRSLVYSWDNVTIQPGQTVGFLHFGAQQYNRAAAIASAERLVQLPPEALTGLSPDEIASIQNFAVPADATSELDPLPGFGTVVTGRLLEADGVTAMGNPTNQTNVRLNSSLIYFGRQYLVASNATGAFTFTASPGATSQISLPLADFTINATYTGTGLVSPTASGAFGDGALTATRDLVFSNAAVIGGDVRRHTGATVTIGGTARLINGTTLVQSVNLAADGRYRFTGVAAGTYTVDSFLNVPPGGTAGDARLTGVTTITTTAGQVYEQDIVIVPTGGLTGTLRTPTGVVVPNRTITLQIGTTTHRTVTTSTAGVFLFTDVPAGAYTLRAQDPVSNLFNENSVVIQQDQTLVQDMTFLGVGTVPVTVVASDGQPLPSAWIVFRRSTDASTVTNTAGDANAAGQLTLTNIPTGAFMVRVSHPQTGSVVVEVNGIMPENGAVVPTQVVLPSVSSVLVQVRTTDGTPVSGAPVSIRRQGTTNFTNLGTTSTAGERTATLVWGTYTIRVDHPLFGSGLRVEVTNTVNVNGQVIPVPITMPITSSIAGTVRDANGVPVAGTAVRFEPIDFQMGAFQVTTNPNGEYAITAVPGGRFLATAIDTISNPDRAGIAQAEVVAPGQLRVDFVLDDVVLPTGMTDVNNRGWSVNTTGDIDSSSAGNSIKYRFNLTPSGSTTAIQFSNRMTVAESELDRRQIKLFDPNISPGFDASRKMYVGPGGYFLRLLDIVENRDSVARTFSISGFDESMDLYQHTVQATSSGDQIIGPDDQWRVTGRTTRPIGAFAHVLTGTGGEVGLAAAASIAGGFPNYRWNEITLQPGEKAALMHFVAQSRTPAAAQAVAERLVQLPAEALEGLTEEERAIIRNFDVPEDGQSLVEPFPTFSGTVFSGDGITPVSGATVTLTSTNSFRDAALATVTDSSGHYSITYPAGPSYSLAVTSPTLGATTTVTGTVAPGETAIARDIVMTTHGGVRGVVRLNGVPVTTGGTVRARRLSNALTLTVPIQPDGSYLFGALSATSYELIATSGGQSSPPTNVFIQQRVTAVRNIEMVHNTGSVTVRVFAADGVTPMPAGTLYILDAVTRNHLASEVEPDGDGIYRPDPFTTPNEFEVQVFTPVGLYSSVQTETTLGPFTAAGQVVDVTLVSTASVLRGTVSDFDGTPVDSAIVLVRQAVSTEDGTYINYYFTEPTGPDGRYLIVGVEPGTVVAQAFDAGPGLLNVEVAAMIDQPAVVVNISLPQSGSVLVSTDGADDTVTLTSNASMPGAFAYATVDQDLGGVVFTRVPLGPFAVQVCDDQSTLRCAATSGNLAADDLQTEVEVGLPEPIPGAFVGSLVAADGVTPVPDTTVLVAAGESTPLGGFASFTTDAAGQFQSSVPFVTPGLHVASTGPPLPAVTTETATIGAPVTFNLVAGSAIDASANTLTGSLSFRYEFGCNGSLDLGATGLFGGSESYNGLRINGLGMGCHLAAASELDGRQIVYAPITMGGLQVTRKVYVPEDGSYVRYVEILTNSAADGNPAPISTELQLGGQLVEPLRLVRSTTETGGAYFVTDDGGTTGRTVQADVLSANTGAATLFPSVRMQLFGGNTTKRYTVTVPDGETRILMHFVVQRAAGDLAGAEAQAQSLVNLTDPNMLTGLSAAERAQIVNFRIP